MIAILQVRVDSQGLPALTDSPAHRDHAAPQDRRDRRESPGSAARTASPARRAHPETEARTEHQAPRALAVNLDPPVCQDNPGVRVQLDLAETRVNEDNQESQEHPETKVNSTNFVKCFRFG